MNKTLPALLLISLLAGAGGYWAGQHGAPATQAPAPAAKAERKILYYRNPMGLPDTSPVPKKDPMGMDYLPVYEGEEPAKESAGTVRINPDKLQTLGVRTEKAELRPLDTAIHAVGRVEPDERSLYTVSPRFEGWIERLHVNATGQPVKKGEVLLEVFSPDLLSAQREYAIAAAGAASLSQGDNEARAAMQRLADAGLARLKNWDIPPDQIALLQQGGEARRTLALRSPVSGVIMERKAVQGARFMPGEVLFQVADLSRVWLVADVFEQDLAAVRPGQTAKVKLNAYPDRSFSAKVSYIYPSLNAQTRTVPVRLELANPQGLLKPAMYADVELAPPDTAPVLTVSRGAVIDSGRGRTVLVKSGDGRFTPRSVETGRQGGDFIEIRSGLTAGEEVVSSGNFLIDSESNLKAALADFGKSEANGNTPAAGKAAAPKHHMGTGTVKQLEPARSSLTLEHAPIASLQWPAMVMPFKIKAPVSLDGLAPGDKLEFELEEQGPGDYAIVKLRKLGSGK